MTTYNSSRRSILAQGLKAARQKANLKSDEAAKLLSEMGLSCRRGTLLAWERGVGTTSREPYASDLPLIAHVYGCNVSDFFSLYGVGTNLEEGAGASSASPATGSKTRPSEQPTLTAQIS